MTHRFAFFFALTILLAIAADVVFNEARAVLKLSFELIELIDWMKIWR